MYLPVEQPCTNIMSSWGRNNPRRKAGFTGSFPYFLVLHRLDPVQRFCPSFIITKSLVHHASKTPGTKLAHLLGFHSNFFPSLKPCLATENLSF